MFERTLGFLGVEIRATSHTERLISVVGAFVGIGAVFVSSRYFLSGTGAFLVVASMGASAVLVFAVPHGPLSQPWPVLGGHLVSAIIGVTCAQLIPDPLLAAPLAVALAIGAMRYLACVHPPGGATALTAVIGGPGVAALGYGFVIAPVLVNVLALLISAIVFNWLFSWRAYPIYLDPLKRKRRGLPMKSTNKSIERDDFVYALSKIDSFIDVNVDDLAKIYDLAIESRDSKQVHASALKLGSCYSNGKYGNQWSVRQIIDWSVGKDQESGSIIYKGVAGAGRRTTGVVNWSEFATWAKYEVFRDEENWRRVTKDGNNSSQPDPTSKNP